MVHDGIVLLLKEPSFELIDALDPLREGSLESLQKGSLGFWSQSDQATGPGPAPGPGF